MGGEAFEPLAQSALIARTRAGDREALAELYDRTFPVVYRFAYRLVGRREDAEDIASETFERAFQRLDRYRSGDVPIEAWLVRIARNVAREQARSRQRSRTVPLSDQLIDQLPGKVEALDSNAVEPLLSALSPGQREVIALRLAGFKLREIADILGKAEGTIKALQHAGIQSMRRSTQL